MAYSDNLRIDLITTGTQAGVWGTTTNTNLGTVIEDAIAGYVAVSVTSANQAFTIVDGAADQARNAMIRLTTTTTANFAAYAPPVSKQYIIQNGSAYTATIYNSTVAGNTTAAGTGVAIPAGKTATVWSNGTDFSSAFTHAPGAFSVGTNLSVSGSEDISASQTIGGSQVVRGNTSVGGTLTTNSSAYLNGAAVQTVDQTTAISTANETITLASAAFSNDLAVVLTSSVTMPTGLSTNTLYYVVETSATSYFSGAGSISGTTLTVSAVYGGSIGVGTVITGSGVATATVTSLISGTGGAGTYGISVSQTAASTTISGTYSGTQTVKLSTTVGGAAVNITAVGSGNLTLTPVSIGITAPAGTSTSALATCAFVSNATSGGGISAQTFTSSGTFTIPSNVTAIKMTIVGGGGNGRGGTDISNGGGGGGGAAIKYLTGITPGNTLTVTVGAAAGTSSVASGTQSITTVSATGGSTPTATQTAGLGGTGSNGDLNIKGEGGGTGMSISQGYPCSYALGFTGGGGSSILGGGAANRSDAGAGSAGGNYGGGGSGANGLGGSAAGGAGAAGVVLIEW
jgi:hypothetical protein